MDTQKVISIVASTAVLSYGIGFIVGQQSTVRNLATVLSREGLEYLAYMDFAKKQFPKM